MFETLDNLDKIANGNQQVFKNGLGIVKRYIKKSPWMLTKKYWRP